MKYFDKPLPDRIRALALRRINHYGLAQAAFLFDLASKIERKRSE